MPRSTFLFLPYHNRLKQCIQDADGAQVEASAQPAISRHKAPDSWDGQAGQPRPATAAAAAAPAPPPQPGPDARKVTAAAAPAPPPQPGPDACNAARRLETASPQPAPIATLAQHWVFNAMVQLESSAQGNAVQMHNGTLLPSLPEGFCLLEGVQEEEDDFLYESEVHRTDLGVVAMRRDTREKSADRACLAVSWVLLQGHAQAAPKSAKSVAQLYLPIGTTSPPAFLSSDQKSTLKALPLWRGAVRHPLKARRGSPVLKESAGGFKQCWKMAQNAAALALLFHQCLNTGAPPPFMQMYRHGQACSWDWGPILSTDGLCNCAIGGVPLASAVRLWASLCYCQLSKWVWTWAHVCKPDVPPEEKPLVQLEGGYAVAHDPVPSKKTPAGVAKPSKKRPAPHAFQHDRPTDSKRQAVNDPVSPSSFWGVGSAQLMPFQQT